MQKKKVPRYWRPLVECPHDTFGPEPEPVIQATMEHYSCSREEALAMIQKDFRRCTYYVNDRYQVEVRPIERVKNLFQLNVRRRDGAPIHDWRDLQQIKNEILGEESEAVELYPAESRKVDTSNKYHLWGYKDPTWRFPVGWEERDVHDDTGSKQAGLRQRAL